MKKPAVLCALFLLAALCYSQEFSDADFLRNLNNTLSNFDFKTFLNSGNGMFYLPSVYMSKRLNTYAGFGLMFNNPFFHNNQLYEGEAGEVIEAVDEIPSTITLLKAALVLRHKKTNVVFYFDYNNDDSWGLSVKLNF
jgi:hypothetical protein